MAAPRKDNVKEIIIKTTEDLLKDKKLSDVSLAEIARTAGISKGTLYYHYKSKDEIFFDITDKYLSEQWQNLVDWTEDESKDTSLHRLVKYVIERNISTAELRMHLFYDAMLGNENIKQRLIERYKEFESIIEEKISERTDAMPAEFLTWLILLTSDGLYVQKMLKNDSFDIEKFIKVGTELIKALK